MPISASRAGPSSGRGLPITRSARSSSASSASEPRGRKTSTRARENSDALSSNDGFSVVAPISVIEPSSITGRKESCCARLKRWISSTNRSVPCPCARRTRAASKIFFSSATPVWIAESCTNVSLRLAPMRRATVVLPLPGGPQKIIEPSEGAASRRVNAPFGPVRCSWPETSAIDIGRSRSASGAGGGSGLGSRPSRRLISPCPAQTPRCPAGRTPACRLLASGPLFAAP